MSVDGEGSEGGLEKAIESIAKKKDKNYDE
jgi:hypothetical protein